MKKLFVIFLFFTIEIHSQDAKIKFAPPESLYSGYGTELLYRTIKHLKDTISKWNMIETYKYLPIVTEAGTLIENDYFGVRKYELISKVISFKKGFYDKKNLKKVLNTLKIERLDFWRVCQLHLPQGETCLVFRQCFVAKDDDGDICVYHLHTDAIFIYEYDWQKKDYVIEDIKVSSFLLN